MILGISIGIGQNRSSFAIKMSWNWWEIWLGCKDSNLNSQNQNLASYH